MSFKTDLAIVNRSFWPSNQIIGEALLQFAERSVETHSVCIITQAHGDLRAALREASRGGKVQICASKARTTSASCLVLRIVEVLIFMLWVFFCLIRTRPKKVYVSTDPPIVVPFIVAIYCWVARARYVYHLQDIHPEAANIVMPLNSVVFKILRWLDCFTLRHADQIITLSATMRDFILARSRTSASITLIDNPAVVAMPGTERNGDIVFCGNAGRLQRIPLLIAAIRAYVETGGKMKFTFAGGGIHAHDLRELAECVTQVSYLGVLPASEAAALVSRHRWALLPIDDEVTEYAFPSKSSSYALSGAGILAICGVDTSVAKWVNEYKAGVVCVPDMKAIVKCFFELEDRQDSVFEFSPEFLATLQIDYFSERLRILLIADKNEENI